MATFDIIETTIASVQQAMLTGKLTCRQLVEQYLAQIEHYDQQGPCINAIISINPQALQDADALDTLLQRTGKLSGPLHGVPVLLKDNINTHNWATTAGSASMANYMPATDAFITARLRQAGALLLAKTNLHEFAIWGETISSILGQSLNPYDLTRTPGGSSGGTGAAIACNMGLIGIGTDTINSVRSPASACNLVGIRPTLGLVSRSGIIPYSLTQDIAGPICRTVEDAVHTLDCIASYDSKDAVTALAVNRRPASYLASLNPDGMRNKRIGVLRSFFGTAAVNMPVNQVIEAAIELMQSSGAIIIPLAEQIDSARLVTEVSVHLDDFKTHLDAHLSALNTSASVHSMADIIASGKYHPGIADNLQTAMQLSVGTASYNEKLIRQADLRTRILKIMADLQLDAIIYPHQQQLVCKTGTGQQQRNGALCAVTGFPSIVVPAGFAPSPDAPIGVPVGMEIIGRPFSEPLLIEVAYGFEQQSKVRQAPLL